MSRQSVHAFPLSPLQQGMLFHHLKEPHSGVDIEQLVVHLPETADLGRLQAAWQWLVQRHEILRARFVWEGLEQPHQEILPKVSVPFAVEDAQRLSQQDQRARLSSFLETDRLQGFELSRAPLLRLTLFRWGDTSSSLVWTFSHALLDGRSIATLLREAFEVYSELDTGRPSFRAEPPSYGRYIDWLQHQSFAAAESFWKQLLAGFTAPTPLVVDRLARNSKAITPHGEMWDALDADATTRLRALAQAHELTLNSLVMGAWAILLHRYSGEEDVLFGATRACRNSSVAEADHTIGPFINTVPVRVKVRGDDPLLSVFQAVRRLWLEMRPYEHTPLSRVKGVSQVPPAQPLFETLVVFEKYRLDAAMRELGGAWTARHVELHELTNFPVTLASYDGQALSFKIEFNRHRLDEDTVRRMLGHVRMLLEGVAADPLRAVRDLPLVTKEERRELIEGINATDAPIRGAALPVDGGGTLHALFEAQVARRPQAIALTCGGHSLTYAELNARANRVARHLGACDVGPNTLVGLCLERSNDQVIAILAVLKAGGAYLPIDLAYPADRLAFMLEDAQAPVLLTSRKLAAALPATHARVLCLDEILMRPAEAGENANLPATAEADHLAYVIYTSGTTGKPKGSLITHRNVVRLFPATERWYGFNERDVWTLFHSTAFDFSVWEMWGALLYGGRLVVVPFLVSRSPEAFYELLAREHVTVLNQTPSAFRQLSEAEGSTEPKPLALRYVIFGGEALEMQSLRAWFERHGDQTPRLVNMYGITETTVHVTCRPLSKKDLSSGSVIGVPISDLQVYVLDPQRQLLPIGVPGEMYVGGAGLGRGYLHRPELTDERFVPDHLSGRPEGRLYKTGDLARLLPGGELEYLGRIDEQVKIRGFRIELCEIESVLREHAAVRDAAVLVREDPPGTKRLLAYLVTTSPAPEVTAVRDHLAQKLPDYMLPAAFVFLPHLPLTANGKVDRKALPAPAHQRPELTERYVAPRTTAERTLAAIWSKVLRVDRVGVHDNFFALGGDSILSIQVASLAHLAGLTLPAKVFFANPTIAKLAAASEVGHSVAGRPETNIEQEVTSGDLPLTPIQHWFFEQNLEEMHHYNQALLLKVAPRLERSLLQRALDHLSRHHDALRLRFVAIGESWRQSYAGAGEPFPLTWVDLADATESEQRREVDVVAGSAQASLILESGPLGRAVYFDLGPDRPGRLLLVIHHLAVDGVSWRLILEDLHTVCEQLKAGTHVELPAKSTSYGSWAKRLVVHAETATVRGQLDYWKSVTGSDAGNRFAPGYAAESDKEGRATALKMALTAEETRALLQDVPAAYNTQMNDVLLTALLLAWKRQSGSAVLYANVEGHGREHVADDIDVSRTVGWFTSIFPVRLELPSTSEAGGSHDAPRPETTSDQSELPSPLDPALGHLPSGEEDLRTRPMKADARVEDVGAALRSVKEQLRHIPQRGIAYGLLRYLSAREELSVGPEPSIVFNYLGQFDQQLTGLRIFRFADEPSGPWHSPRQQRRHAVELNSLVIGGRLELQWTFSSRLTTNIPELASEFLSAIKRLIEHCRSRCAATRTPSDFPLARLDQQALDRLLASAHDVEDVYPLSPIQMLFFSAGSPSGPSAFDQWHCTLRGTLDVPAFQRAWQHGVDQHTVLRSTIHGDGLPEPVQVVHRTVNLPWIINDWRGVASGEIAERWSIMLEQDHAQPLRLSDAPAMRFALARVAEQEWKFLWSVPPLLLDGWSWPLVFRDVSRSYEAFSQGIPAPFQSVRPYRDYVEWIHTRSSSDEALEFWRQMLVGFREPTPFPVDAPEGHPPHERYAEHPVMISAETTSALQLAARRLQVTLNALVQGAWALLLNHQGGATDVVFGAAFAGRPPDLVGAESIVGPFVNNLPVRISVETGAPAGQFLRKLHSRLLEIAPYQFTPLLDVQRRSEMPWRHRLFDSLVVFQNYAVDESARRFGQLLYVDDFAGPVHTNYPLTVLVEPAASLSCTLIRDRQRIGQATAERWANDLAVLLTRMPACLDGRVGELQAGLSPRVPPSVSKSARPSKSALNFVPPQTELERTIAGVWQRIFGLEQVGSEDNFFDLGGTSLLLVQMHHQLQQTLKTEFSVVTLFKHPTVRSLAHDLSAPDGPVTASAAPWRQRAARQKQALTQLRVPSKK